MACEDKGVKRQHEHILHAAVADGGGGAGRRLPPVRGAKVPSPAAVFAVSLLAGVSLAVDEPVRPASLSAVEARKGAVLMSMQADPVVRVLVPPEGAFYVDILTRLGEAFRFEDLETQRLPFEGLLVTVVTPRQLYLMKKDTVRPKDRVDAEALRRKFGLPDD